MTAGLIFLGCLIVGLFVAALRFFPFGPDTEPLRLVLTIAGASVAAVGLIGYIISLVRGIKPKDALIITNKGFTNLLIGGKDGVYVDWIQVRSLRIFGLRKSPTLGITLADENGYLSMLDGKDLREAEYSRSVGLPVISIAQKDVKTDIEELKNMFSRMVKGAISWENYMRQEKRKEAVETGSEAVSDPVPASGSAPEKPQYKSFAERRREAEMRDSAFKSGEKDPKHYTQSVLFPDEDDQEPVPAPSGRRSLFGEDAQSEEPAVTAAPAGTNDDIREYTAGPSDDGKDPYGTFIPDDDMEEIPADADPEESAERIPAEADTEPDEEIIYEEEPAPKAAAFGSEDDEDDGLLSLEDDEDPVPVEMPGQAGKTAENPFSAFDKTETKDAITILDLDD